MRIWLLVAVFLLSLNLGVAEAIGIRVSLLRIALDFCMVVLLTYTLSQASRIDLLRSLRWLALPLLATLVGVAVALLHRANPLEILLFLREMLMPLLYFAVFLLDPPNNREWRALTALLLAIATIQLPIAAFKYWTIGINEKIWIGTFHQHAGQLGLLMPMVGVAFLWAYAINRQRLLIPTLLATCFALISVVNEKRGIILLLPALVVLLIAADLLSARLTGKQWKRIWYLKPAGLGRLLTAFLLSWGIVITCAIQSIPSFDTRTADYQALRERSVTAYIREYLMRDYDSAMNRSDDNPDIETNRNIQMGRLRLLMHGIDIAVKFPVDRLLFGTGGGWLLEHPLLKDKPADLMFKRLRLRGPASTGLRQLFEFGAAGLLLMGIWFVQVGWGLIRRASNPMTRLLALGATGVWSIQVFDYLIYSQVGWGGGVFMPLCSLIVASALRNDRQTK